MKVKQARKAYRKAKTYKERDSIAGSFIESQLKRIENTQGLSPAQWRALIKSIVIDAEYFAAVSVEYSQGWKIHKDWMKCIIAQLIGNSESARALYSHYGWNYQQCINPMYSESTIWHDVEFIEKETREKKRIRILLESIGQIPLGSIWRNSYNQKFTVTSIEQGKVYCEAQDVYGEWFDTQYTKEEILSMRKVC